MALSSPQMAGDQLNPADMENHTLLVIPVEFREHVPTIHTKPGEQSPCIVVNVAHLSAEGGAPVIYRGVMWFNTLLHGGLKRQIGQTILGRMVKGQGQPGKNPPWQLLDLLNNPSEAAWVQFAEGWLAGPEGKAWELEGQQAAASGPAVASPAAAQQAAPAVPAPPAAPAMPPAPVAAPPATAPVAVPPTIPAAPPAAPAGPPAANAGSSGTDPMAMLAAMPEEERAKFMAVLANQNQAAH